jgi:hypothetical protein
MSSAHGGGSLLSRMSLHNSLLASHSRSTLRMFAALIGLFVFAVVGVADWLMFDAGWSPLGIMLGSDAVGAVLTAWFALKLINQSYERRQMVRRRLELIGETNHHIRNALELIQFSAQTTHDQQVIENISSAVDRIQWVLREMLGDGTKEYNEPPRSHGSHAPQ